MTGTNDEDTTTAARANSAAVLDDIAARAEAAARALVALAPTPKQRGTVALVGLAAFERELARAVRS